LCACVYLLRRIRIYIYTYRIGNSRVEVCLLSQLEEEYSRFYVNNEYEVKYSMTGCEKEDLILF